jgi:hypothetical protein
MKSLSILIIALLFTIAGFSQGTLRGKITDESGESLIGVTVVFKDNRSVGTVTDFDGNFSLKFPDATPKTIVISYISYAETEETFSIKDNSVTVKNFIMKPATKAIGEVEITAKAVKSKDYYVESIKRNSAVTLDYISSETIKKTGDANVTAAVARVSGVSTNGDMLTVRGIGDRYIKTAVNGSVIPTLDPFKSNIKLDLFPSSLIDNIIITKTASADLPGDWSGAYISIETKDYPDKLTVNAESSFGYNTQSTFKDVISSERSGTDWLGHDDGLRDFDHTSFVTAVPEPSAYQEFVALGLGSYFASLGVTEDNWGQASPELYFKLGLVQLGLLAPAQIGDKTAVDNAKAMFANGDYHSRAFSILNASVPETGKSLPSNWNTTVRKAPIDFSQSLSFGNQSKLFKKDIGYIFGIKYGNGVTYAPSAVENRASVATADDGVSLVKSKSSTVREQIGRESNGWSGLANIAFKPSSNHSIAVLFMPNFNGTNKVRNSIDDVDREKNLLTRNMQYEQRKQLVYQLKTEHFLPGPKMKIELNASYTNGKSTTPDFKNVQFVYRPELNIYQIGGEIGNGVHRYFRYLTDNLFDSHVSAELPVGNMPGLTRKVKFGAAYQRNERKSVQYDYEVKSGDHKASIQNDDLNNYFNLDNFGISSGVLNGVPYNTINDYYVNKSSAADNTFGNSEIKSGFALIDYSVNALLRAYVGLRVEDAHLFTDVFLFDSLGYASNDPRRQYSDAYPLVNPGTVDETTFLPSANLIYKINPDEKAPVNLRVNYSKSIARPSIRELSDVQIYDFELKENVYGNSELKSVHINNYDVRLESYFKNEDNISASVFYKTFKDPIELVRSNGYTWQNAEKSYVAGIELEGKKSLTKQLEFRANFTFVKSETEYVRTRMEISSGVRQYIPLDTVKRSMYGQSPYVLNGILSYNFEKIGLVSTISYNVQGPKLVIVSSVKEIPDVYELQRHMIDVKLTKKINNNFNISLAAHDLLNTYVQKSYNYEDEGWDFLYYEKYRTGTSYTLSIAYNL